MSHLLEVFNKIADTKRQESEIEDLGIGIIVIRHIIKISKGIITVNDARTRSQRGLSLAFTMQMWVP